MNRRHAIKTTALAGIALAPLPRTLARSAILPGASADSRQADLPAQILADRDMSQVLRMAHALLGSGLHAGSGYRSTWIRDLNTFIQISLTVNPPQRLRDALLVFFKFQGTDGNIVDLYRPHDPLKPSKDTYTAPLVPHLTAEKNTVASDQESSLVQAVFKYVFTTQDHSLLDERIADISVRDRLGLALRYLLTERFDSAHGLVWSATRADWGDVQPESPRGVRLDASSHRALSIYDNAMLVIAIDSLLQLPGRSSHETAYWTSARDDLQQNIRKHLWDVKNQKFIPHVYLAGSPFPAGFEENAISYHGGTTVAIEAGLLEKSEVLSSLQRMEANVLAAGAASIGLTLYPAYPEGFFKNPEMRDPYSYQNGGDWCWFGGRMIQQLVRLGYIAEAYRNLKPMVERVVRTGGFHEWWTRDNKPRGSGDFRGSAGVLAQAIDMLHTWAQQNIQPSPGNKT